MNPNENATQPDLEKRLAAQEEMLAKIYVSVEKTRKYFFWTGVITVAAIVLPLIGLAFAIPSYLSTLTSYTGF